MKSRRERRTEWLGIGAVAVLSLALLAVREIFDLSNWTLLAGAGLFLAGMLVGLFVAFRR